MLDLQDKINQLMMASAWTMIGAVKLILHSWYLVIIIFQYLINDF